MPSGRHDALVRGRHGILAFRDLPEPCRLALAHHPSSDGNAWTDQGRAGRKPVGEISRAMARHVEERGDRAFGVATLPLADDAASVIGDRDLRRFWSLEAYHAWLVSGGRVPSCPRTGRWPCVLSEMAEETFEDGWHRFHAHVRAGHEDIPVVSFPGPRHLPGRVAGVDGGGTRRVRAAGAA